MPANSTPTNRLASETSPYLRQHGTDPVDWFPWGPEALATAGATGKPIFLSVGYASCHWCHVMHRESFADEATARILNEHFVSIKVDRESRPDIDELYMGYVAAVTGRGGWPMSVFLTPDLIPVFGGTYFPPRSTPAMPGFPDVLERVIEAFAETPHELASTAEESLEYLRSMFAPREGETPSSALVNSSARQLIAAVDPVAGGLGPAPKFPQAPVIDFLLDFARTTGDEHALDAAEATMDGIVGGGIYDQVGGGIARYAVDSAWLVPHFEKMLYDNAQLLSTLARLHTLRPRDEWAYAMRHTARFLDRDLAAPSGAYASSLDADTNGVEGATYMWPYEELAEVLTADELDLAMRHLGVTASGNWEGATILTRREGRRSDAEAVDLVLEKLLATRLRRPQPAVDDKVIVAWNALAARGLIAAGRALSDKALLERGTALVRLLLDHALGNDGSVCRLVTSQRDSGAFVLEDTAGLALAALTAADALGAQDRPSDRRVVDFVDAAGSLMTRASEIFHDGDGTWYMTAPSADLPARPRETHDGPAPSGPSMAALCAVRLAVLQPDGGWRNMAEATLTRLADVTRRSPSSAGTALSAMLELLNR